MCKCPRDRHHLVERSFGSKSAWLCNVCDGAFTNLGQIDVGARKTLIPRESWDVPIRCPIDNAVMELFRYKSMSVDICPACSGIWLDGEEIEKITAVARSRSGTTASDWVDEVVDNADLGSLLEAALEGLFSGL
jgi:Zn-finger nucleic acid-binding protein